MENRRPFPTRPEASISRAKQAEQAMRQATITRNTNETSISDAVELDGTGQRNIATGIGFFDQMRDQRPRPALIDPDIAAGGRSVGRRLHVVQFDIAARGRNLELGGYIPPGNVAAARPCPGPGLDSR